MMNSILLAFVGCLYLAANTVSAESIKEKAGHYFENRPRIGHFKQDPFIDLYKTYATAFVLPKHPDRHPDDYRNYLPSGLECMVFFQKFQVDSYKLRDLDDFIVLDACLGYLFESEYKESDSEDDSLVASSLPAWMNDEELKSIYEGTKINELDDDTKICIYNLLEESVRVKKQFSDLTCNNHWLQVFLNFARCQGKIKEETRSTDSYLNIMYELVSIRGRECFLSEIRLMNEALRKDYVNNPMTRVKNRLSMSSINQQANTYMWPKEVKDVLTAFQGAKKGLNLREVNGILRGMGIGNENFKQRLLRNLAEYANSKVNLKKRDPKDPQGSMRYKALVDQMCNYFRPSNNPGFYDFATPLKRMVEMMSYPEVFSIDKKYFLKHVVNHSFESAPIYFSVSACNLITFTHGQFEMKPQNSKFNYIVGFVPDTSKMVVWPDSGFF